MRGLSLIALLLALAVVGYMQLNRANTTTATVSGTSLQSAPARVEQDIDAALEQRRKSLEEATAQ